MNPDESVMVCSYLEEMQMPAFKIVRCDRCGKGIGMTEESHKHFMRAPEPRTYRCVRCFTETVTHNDVIANVSKGQIKEAERFLNKSH
jgi:DNA-directed RNA polymerase subunit RPC12/RpoP